jgi:hypothetical protein
MANTVLLVPSRSLGNRHLPDLQDFCSTLSTFLQEDVGLWTIGEAEWKAALDKSPSVCRLEQMDHHGEPIEAAPMSSAPFQYRDDGRPDWGAMWQGFCELALYGGPPHRGADQALGPPSSSSADLVRDEMVEEIIRGIAETTMLWAEPAPGGWLRVTCDSRRMAAWMCATIILENVDARVEDKYLFVPADRGFELKDQVKSVITVLAKTHHYWQAHLEAESGELSPARLEARSILLGENIAKLRGAA